MKDITLIFETMLSPERSTSERLQSLSELRPHLQNDEAISKLAEAVPAEASLEVKGAMLELLCSVEFSSITNRSTYIECFTNLAVFETETSLRYLAIKRIARTCMHDQHLQVLLSDILVHDMHPLVQLKCIEGLQKCAQKTPDTISNVLRYVPIAAEDCRTALFELVKQFEKEDAEIATLQFLNPWEDPQIRLSAIDFLSAFSSLSVNTISKLLIIFQDDANSLVKEKIVALLDHQSELTEETFAIILDTLVRIPYFPAFIDMLRNRLVAQPGLLQLLQGIFKNTSSAILKRKVLLSLRESENIDIFLLALKDENTTVRYLALLLCYDRYEKYSDKIDAALIEAIPLEKVSIIRKTMLAFFISSGRKSSAVDNFLVEWSTRETDPATEAELARVVLSLNVTDANRIKLLTLFLRVLKGAFFSEDLKGLVMEKMQSFVYSNEPELKACLSVMLENTSDIYDLEIIYNQLKTHETDFAALAPALLRTLYKHIGYFPQEPLTEWLHLFGKLAASQPEIRKQLPYIISLTGAHWLLSETDKTAQTSAFLPVFQKAMHEHGMKAFIEASRLLSEAWENRTIKKSDVVALYSIMLSLPYSDGLLQQLLDIMVSGKLVTPELVQSSIDYLMLKPDPAGEHLVLRYLQQVGYLDLEYRQRVIKSFTQENYNHFCLLNEPLSHIIPKIPQTFNDWEHANWRNTYRIWPLAQLYFELEPGEDMFTLFDTLPSPQVPGTRTIQYIVLDHLWRSKTGKWSKFLSQPVQAERFMRALFPWANQINQDTQIDLQDRAQLIFWSRWSDYKRQLKGSFVPSDISASGSEVYINIIARYKLYDKDPGSTQFPAPIDGMNLSVLKEKWAWQPELLEKFLSSYFPQQNQEKEAEELYQHGAALLSAGKQQEGKAALQQLLQQYHHTKFAAANRQRIEAVTGNT